jgi:hypothetical protein
VSHERFLPEDAQNKASKGLLYVSGGFSIWEADLVTTKGFKHKLSEEEGHLE